MERASALAVPSHAYQLGLFTNNGVLEASALHVSKTGFFAVCSSSPEDKKLAERQRMLLDDLRDYETRSESWGMMRALNSGRESLDQAKFELRENKRNNAWMASAFRQKTYHVKAMPHVIEQLFREDLFSFNDYWISQHGFNERNRQATNLLHLNGLYLDIDIEKSDHWSKRLNREQQAMAFADWAESENIPLSIILHTGGGLHVKIWFEDSVPAIAKPIWDCMERTLIRRAKDAGWPVDEAVCDVSRVLRVLDSFNQKNNLKVILGWSSGTSIADAKRYSFNWLADSRVIMPFTRAEVREFRKVEGFYKENERKAIAAGVRTGLREAQLHELSGRQLWHFRLDVMRRYVAGHHPDGVPVGMRNNYAFMAALSLAYSCGDYDDYAADLLPIIREICPTLSVGEIRSSASSVTKRVLNDNKNQYKYKNETFLELLKIPESFVHKVSASHGFSSRDKSSWDIGVMGYEKMSDLPFEEYVLETKRRQSEAAKRTNLIQSVTNAQKKVEAIKMSKERISTREIAKVLNVSQTTIQNWCNREIKKG